MKKIHLFTYLLALLSVVWSCEEKDNLDPIGNWELTPASLTNPAPNGEVVLDEDNPTAPVRFEWAPAVSSKNYGVRYSLVLVEAGSQDISTPIYRTASATSGRDLFATPTARQIDQALSIAGYEAGSTVELQWGVVARSLDKESVSFQPVSITRFLTESAPLELYLSGPATEAGTNLADAIPMKAFTDGDGNPTSVFEVYTSLKAGQTFNFYSQPSEQSLAYGGANGQLLKDGAGISAPSEGTYRITVDFNANTYNLLKIDKWSVVGGIISGGWGGDEPLAYKGNGVWQGSVDLVEAGGFLFRANGDWAYLFKRIKGTTNQLVMESQAAAAGLEFEDIPSTGVGRHIFTLNLQGDTYTYTIEEDNSVQLNPPGAAPDKLFLLAGSELVAELTKDGTSFRSGRFLALQTGVTYRLNSARDGSGTNYTLAGELGETNSPDSDAPTGGNDFGQASSGFTVARDQAYQLTVNFATARLSWKYYNIKLFHWNNDGGWDARNEYLMTYVHPYTFTLEADLTAGFDMKFNSPWEVEFGADAPAALSGTMTNKGGANFKNITQSGTYQVIIEVASDYSIGTYEFVKK